MKRLLPLLFLFSLLVVACSLPATIATSALTEIAGADDASPTPAFTQIAVSAPALGYGAAARGYINTLTEIGPRLAGTEQEARAAEAIADLFAALGYPTETQPFTAIDDYGEAIDSLNVVAVKRGESAQEIIVGAHYDSADEGLGADDNASGVAVMLEAAGLIANVSTPYTVRFIAFGAEEAGLLGSYVYLNQMSQAEVEDTVAMVNLDSLAAGDITYVYSDEDPQADLRDWTLGWASANGFGLQTIYDVDLSDGEGGGVSDYAAFREAGIPYIYFEATNWTLGDEDGYTQVDYQYGEEGQVWHTRYDTLDYLDATFPGRVDQHLDLFVQALYAVLTQYEVSAQ